MELNKTEAAILAGSPTVEGAGANGAEIDLYDELIIFAGLSPEEQRRMLVRPKKSGEDAVAASYSNSVVAGWCQHPASGRKSSLALA